jgi:histidine kinase
MKIILILPVLTFLAAAGLIFILGRQISKNQAELNRQKEEYRNLFEMVPCEIAVIDRELRLIHFNTRFVSKFNPSRGQHCFYAFKGRSSKCASCPVEKTFQDGKAHLSEETGYFKNGRSANWLVATSPQKDRQGHVTAVMEMFVDLTEKKQLENRLRESEKKYKDIFNNIANPIFVIDRRDLTILDCNQSATTLYGYSGEEIRGFCFSDLFVSSEKNLYAAKIKTLTEIHRVRHIRKNQKALFVNIRVSPSQYEDKMVYLVTISDITQRLEAEQQLIQASKMATLGEMATGVAHELNQPLSVIRTASSFLMKKIKQKSAIDDQILFTMASEIDSHIKRATRIINHMREFGRKSDIYTEPVYVGKVIEKALEIFARQLELRGIEVITDFAPGLPPVKADASKLEQVIINLLINARDAMDETSSQPETNGHAPEKKIYVRTRQKNQALETEVEDTGPGIGEELIDKIFEPFFTTKQAGKGTGLGLSISYSILREWGAVIWAEAGRSKGARFVISFPLKEEKTSQRLP